MTPREVAELRADTAGCAERIHLNNAGAGLMPGPVARAIHEHLDLEERIGGYEAAAERQPAIQAGYEALAELLHARPRNVAFTDSATGSYARVLSAFRFERDDVVLTTTNDYVSNQIMFLSLAERCGVRVAHAGDLASGEVDLEGLARQIGALRPKLVAVTHAPTNSGLLQPVEAIGKLCREAEVPYLVDACQSVGQVDVDVRAIDCDFLTATSRKFLRGPRGYGFLFVADRMLNEPRWPLLPDLRSATWSAADSFEPVATARRYEYWEQPYALLLGTAEAARYAMRVGLPRIAARVRGLAGRCRELLAQDGLRVLDPEQAASAQSAIVTVAVPGRDGGELRAKLFERRVNASISPREFATLDYDRKGVDWALRLSPHYYNTDEEVDQAMAIVVELASEAECP